MAKLTLSIDENIIKQAKQFARESNTSVSALIESYLARITSMDPEGIPGGDLSELIGVISLDKDFDEKQEIRKRMSDKH